MGPNLSRCRRQAEGDLLSTLLAHPDQVSDVPVGLIPVLMARLAAEQAALCAVQALLTQRILELDSKAVTREADPDRLLTANEVAAH